MSPTGSFKEPVDSIITASLPGLRVISLVELIVLPLISKVSITILPVPLARSSKSELEVVVVM